MDRALREWLRTTAPKGEEAQYVSSQGLRLSYTIYGHMVLLPAGALDRLRLPSETNNDGSEVLQVLYQIMAKHLKVTHIAINAPIPALAASGDQENILRAPINLQPLHGDFGPSTCSEPPTREDFDKAFWVTAKQNNIYQTWAPRWTMFSRGNISEKARLATLPSVQRAVAEGVRDGRGCAAVDLFAGIGYFAFSYLKAGVSKVLCWDLNPWSIEGLRRGAARNKWTTATTDSLTSLESMFQPDTRLVVFDESNEMAANRVHKLRSLLPPIRHVNCGLLPTSSGSWAIALDVLDASMGGWVHVHENFAVKEIEQKSQEVRGAIQQMLDERRKGLLVQIEEVNRLKSYAPGVIHCVIDIYIPPHQPG